MDVVSFMYFCCTYVHSAVTWVRLFSSFPVLMEKKKKKKDWTYHFNRKFPIFPLQIESDYKLTLGSTGPRRMCPFPQDRRMLVEQLIGRLSCCQISPASNWFILQWITYSSSWNLLHGSKGWFGSEEAVWSASELHIKSTNLMLGWRRHCLWKSEPL